MGFPMRFLTIERYWKSKCIQHSSKAIQIFCSFDVDPFWPIPQKTLEIDLSSQCGRGIFGVFKTVHGDLGRIRCSTGWFQAGNLQWQTYCIQLFGDRFAFGFTWLANCSIGRMTHRIDLVSTCFIHYWLARGIRVSEASICASQIYSFAEAVYEPHHWAQFNIFSLGAHMMLNE